TVATPGFNPGAGTYSTAQTVAITCSTAGATIRYTTNGTIPTTASPIYNTPLTISGNTTLKAKGFKTNWASSDVSTATYIITGTVATPTFDPPAGDYEEAIDVVIASSTPGAQVRYTTDGSEPDATSELFTSPLHIDQDIIIKAKAFLLDWTPSTTVTADFNIGLAIDDPNAIPLYTGIYQVYPNPFSEIATIRMGFKEANSNYKLNIYNLRGELVHTSSGHAQGYVDYYWKGCDNRGKRLSSGVYLISLSSNGTHKTRKIVLK
ncbi:MAG: chitobiase/beta-hexosaminidase C-terminal domain-containing protein, partial [Candidatus Cloacimonetes bacterium]|nr:chitobiase/beta-hexosaminidase C-terminal domain-containing protein [Candidatus Cloacimonadota bacterium]